MEKILAGKRYMMTLESKSEGIRKFPVKITSVTERDDYFYVGYTPDDFRVCRWGYTRVYKDGKKRAVNTTLTPIL